MKDIRIEQPENCLTPTPKLEFTNYVTKFQSINKILHIVWWCVRFVVGDVRNEYLDFDGQSRYLEHDQA